MKHIQIDGAQLNELGSLVLMRPFILVVIAANDGDRCDQSQRIENVRTAEVARVDDVIASLKKSRRFRSQKAVRVLDQSNACGHMYRAFVHPNAAIGTRTGNLDRVTACADASLIHASEHRRFGFDRSNR
jgi:hypothetical protein